MAKKRSDGYIKKTFTVDGKKYYIYGKMQRNFLRKKGQSGKKLRTVLKSETILRLRSIMKGGRMQGEIL